VIVSVKTIPQRGAALAEVLFAAGRDQLEINDVGRYATKITLCTLPKYRPVPS